MKHWPFYLLLIAGIYSCRQIRPWMQTTVRGKYESGFHKKDSFFVDWKAAHERAMAAPLHIKAPYSASIQIKKANASALVYILAVSRGERLVAEVKKPADSSRFLLEFFNGTPSATETLLAELPHEAAQLQWVATQDDSLRVSLQPGLKDSGIYHVRIYKQPAYEFPVAGKNSNAIQSFWGADRDGGARAHEGVDIFAARGTPVVAVARGRVGFTGNKGLGGKQVWLREEEAGFNVYYAHLDSFVVSDGDRVQPGDTLGFVGNTGNAAGGAPHLHFGVYGGGGAVNPLSFVKQLPVPPHQAFAIEQRIPLLNSVLLRAGPGNNYRAITQLQKNEALQVLARAGNWLHITVRDTLSGFIPR